MANMHNACIYTGYSTGKNEDGIAVFFNFDYCVFKFNHTRHASILRHAVMSCNDSNTALNEIIRLKSVCRS